MLDVYICEDEKEQLDLFSGYVSNTILIEDLDMRLALSTQDYHELLELFPPSGNTAVFFLDIDLKSDIDGLMLAQRIRQLQPRCFIVFITSHGECGMETCQYKVEALDFIRKGDTKEIQERIKSCLLDVAEKIRNDPKIFHYKIGERHASIPFDQIVCFQTAGDAHKITVHAMNKTSEFSGSLKNIEKSLDKRFYRCHRSFLVNKDNIREIDFQNQVIYMVNGDECLISSRMMKGLK